MVRHEKILSQSTWHKSNKVISGLAFSFKSRGSDFYKIQINANLTDFMAYLTKKQVHFKTQGRRLWCHRMKQTTRPQDDKADGNGC